jgi:hypothetical protein
MYLDIGRCAESERRILGGAISMRNQNSGQGQPPETAYSQADQAHLPTIAQEFINRFSGVNTPQAQQYAQVDPNSVTPDQLAEMHRYASDSHPGLLGEVMQHPFITAALGGFAIYEADTHLRKHVEQQNQQPQ